MLATANRHNGVVMFNRIAITLVALVALALSGCYQFPPPTVVKQTTPSPFVGAKAFVIAPVTFDGFTFGGESEEAWLRTRSPAQVASWQKDKATMNQKLMKMFKREKVRGQTYSFGTPPGQGQFVVAVNFDRYDGQMRWTAEIRDASGEVVDIVRDPHAVTANFSIWLALETGAQQCALMVSKYLQSRAFPAVR